MKKFILMFTCVLCFLVSGCADTIKNVSVIAATGTTAYVGHKSVVEVIVVNLDVFSTKEVKQLIKVNDRICIVKDKVDMILEQKNGDVAKLVMNLPVLIPLYAEAKEAYLVAHGIIMSRVDEFSIIDHAVLVRYSDTCSRLDVVIQEAIVSGDKNNNVQLVMDILVFIVLVGKIVLPMLIV